MDRYKELAERLKAATGGRETVLTQGIVTKVDGLLCEVKIGGLTVPDVRLRASEMEDSGQLLIVPKVGTAVTVGSLTGGLSELVVLAVDHVDIMGYRLEHGHVDSGVRPVIIGHEHPSIRIAGSVGGGMKMLCFVHAEREGVIVMPPFSPFSSGNDLVADEDCVMAPALKACDFGSARIYGITDMGLMDMGTLRDLSDVKV